MPIEIQIEKKYGKNLPVTEVQSKARAYALEQLDRQRKDFKRLGVLGDWDNPYLTMNFSNEADEIRVLARILEKGYVFRGLKPVNWCFDCGSALAEAEVEYADRVDPAVDVAFPFIDKPGLARAFGLDSVEDGAIVIWTTTPWTIPSNQALNVHPEIEYALVRVSPTPVHGPLILIAKERSRPACRAGAWKAKSSPRPRARPCPGCVSPTRWPRRPKATTAARPSTWAITSPWTPAPAWCIRRPPTASRTSFPARRTAWPTPTS